MIKLDLGCGRKLYAKGWTGIDSSEDSVAEHICKLGREPIPYPDESVDEIRSSHFLEHLTNDELIHLMNECWRVLKWDGKMWHHVPHADCEVAKQDPTHKNQFVPTSMKFFCGKYLNDYSLDYGINCIFYGLNPEILYPDGKDKANHYTEIRFGLLKNDDHYNEWKGKFPFTKPARKKKRPKPKNWVYSTGYKTAHNKKFKNEMKQVAKKLINEHIDEILRIKYDATERYGADPDPLGSKGLFADINRKFTRARLFLWEGQEMTSESIENTLYDLAVYSILALMARKSEDEKEKKNAN